jgi:hypothetical protein
VELTDWWRETLLPLSRLQGFILPATLALLTLVVQQSLARRTERNEVWKGLLPQFMERTEKYYLPLSLATGNFLKYADKAKSDSSHNRVAFYSCMVFLYRRRMLKEKIGGITFKNRDGEELASKCLGRILNQTDERLDWIARDTVLAQMRPNETYAHFLDKLTGSLYGPTFLNLEQQLVKWINGTDYPQLRVALRVLGFTIDREVNRPLEKWYENREVVEQTEVEGIRSELSGDAELEPSFTAYADLLV